MLGSAQQKGVFLSVITGGEPLLREGILEIFQKHKRILFLMITNGTLLDNQKASLIAKAGNIITVVSLEGLREQTDRRRGSGVFEKAVKAMGRLRKSEATFGFSAMVTGENYRMLCSDQFINQMIARGCSLGFYTEYIPIGREARWNLVLKGKEQDQFRKRILEIRKKKPMMVVHMPDDEYGSDRKCMGVMGGCAHINAQGYVEPCPFTHMASENILEKGLDAVFRSRFLAQLRASDAVCRKGRLGCALFENQEMVQEIAAQTGAKPTDVDFGVRE